jgi:hypothetical protein
MKVKLNQFIGESHRAFNDLKFKFDEFMQIYYGRSQLTEYHKHTYLIYE